MSTSFRQLEDSMQVLCLTNLPNPPHANQFYDVPQMIDEINWHYSEKLYARLDIMH